jgi:hypothetical protein
MSGGYSKAEVLENIRKTRSLKELHGLAYPPKNTMHQYAIKEAKAEIKRRLTGKRIKNKPKRSGMTMQDLMRI